KDETAKHELIEFASFHQIDSCATDGLCSLACPVTINTGEYMLTKRAETNKMLGKSYHKAAKHIDKRDATIRAGLKIGHVVSNIIGGKQLQSLTGFLSHIVQIPQWIPAMPGISTTISHMNPNAEIYYIPSCTTRFFTKPEGALQSLPELVMSLAQQSGIAISIPSSIEERCCGLAFDSKGDTESGNIAMDRWKQDIPSNAMLLTDAYSCQAHIQQSMKTIDIIDFAELVLDSLNIQPIKGTAILHPPCSLQMQHGVQRLKAIAERCAMEVFIPESVGCCGFAGDHGFHHPELVVHACKDMRAEISAQRNVLGYYSINPTCELGMQIGTGNVYRSILYLIDQAIKP
ncbi:MAG: heterodisulfide reductase-related iron-sulfur binding cluster, partial [Candidatus Kapaibacteriota bacterium]